jgi:hypothetical protein
MKGIDPSLSLRMTKSSHPFTAVGACSFGIQIASEFPAASLLREKFIAMTRS